MHNALGQGGTSFDALYVNVNGRERLLRPVTGRLRAGGSAVPALRHGDPSRTVHEPIVLSLPALSADSARRRRPGHDQQPSGERRATTASLKIIFVRVCGQPCVAGSMLSVMRLKSLFAVRDVDDLIAETHEEGESLRRTIGAFGLTAMGVGAIIGTGIFVVIGQGVALAGPSLVLSFILAAVTCLFSALSYAELPQRFRSPAARTPSPTPRWAS